MMGLETLLEAAKYLEYRAEVEARGEKGFPDLPTNNNNSASVTAQQHSPTQNGYTHHHHQNGVGAQNGHSHYTNGYKSSNAATNGSSSIRSRVPEPVNGYHSKQVSDHSYRRNHHDSTSPTDFGGTNRSSKNGSSNGNGSLLNNRNSGTREVHNKLEKNRRAHLKECFELLKSQLPAFEDRKISNLAILRSSLRHIQTLKRKEREFEHEMERLAREKISLQQRLSQLKKDMLSKLEHLDWQAVVQDDADLDMDNSVSGDGKGSLDGYSLDNHRSPKSGSNSPASDIHRPYKSHIDLEDSGDSQHPVSLTVSNCHLGKNVSVNKVFGQINGMNGVSGNGPISLVTTAKLSSSPLTAITAEKTANSPVGGASYVNMLHNSSKGFAVMNPTAVMGSNGKIEMGQYYNEDKLCK